MTTQSAEPVTASIPASTVSTSAIAAAVSREDETDVSAVIAGARGFPAPAAGDEQACDDTSRDDDNSDLEEHFPPAPSLVDSSQGIQR
ncbi:hypothetical protein [Ensifer aridi]|uniref:hypothetical protein n=1 Tax=Ensifer aridi TaxID=1708715 RepID=UPI000A109E7D|nr:hypothetical protein [Ensifer aridi]